MTPHHISDYSHYFLSQIAAFRRGRFTEMGQPFGWFFFLGPKNAAQKRKGMGWGPCPKGGGPQKRSGMGRGPCPNPRGSKNAAKRDGAPTHPLPLPIFSNPPSPLFRTPFFCIPSPFPQRGSYPHHHFL